MNKTVEERKPDWAHQDTWRLGNVIKSFEEFLPGWWYSMGAYSVSCHASCAPDVAGQDAALLKNKRFDNRLFDNGFHADLAEGDLADALAAVLKQGLVARAAVETDLAMLSEQEKT